jgi:hypothetical protein
MQVGLLLLKNQRRWIFLFNMKRFPVAGLRCARLASSRAPVAHDSYESDLGPAMTPRESSPEISSAVSGASKRRHGQDLHARAASTLA